MAEEIAVVKPYYQKEEAYRLGYNQFADLDLGDAEPDLSGFRDGAQYTNTVLPRLRAMAGFTDDGHGTYQGHRQVAAIKPGCEEDHPADAQLVESYHIYDELSEAWDRGARDAIDGRDADP